MFFVFNNENKTNLCEKTRLFDSYTGYLFNLENSIMTDKYKIYHKLFKSVCKMT